MKWFLRANVNVSGAYIALRSPRAALTLLSARNERERDEGEEQKKIKESTYHVYRHTVPPLNSISAALKEESKEEKKLLNLFLVSVLLESFLFLLLE